MSATYGSDKTKLADITARLKDAQQGVLSVSSAAWAVVAMSAKARKIDFIAPSHIS